MTRRESPVVTIHLSTPEETEGLAQALSGHLGPGDVIGLDGELGAGKTFFVQAACRSIGVSEDFPVRSPSFAVIHEYPGRMPVYHIDLYRMRTTSEISDLGLEEYLQGDGVTFVEWFEKLGDPKPDAYILLCFEILDERSRRVTLKAEGARYEEMVRRTVAAFAKRLRRPG